MQRPVIGWNSRVSSLNSWLNNRIGWGGACARSGRTPIIIHTSSEFIHPAWNGHHLVCVCVCVCILDCLYRHSHACSRTTSLSSYDLPCKNIGNTSKSARFKLRTLYWTLFWDFFLWLHLLHRVDDSIDDFLTIHILTIKMNCKKKSHNQQVIV